MTSHDGTVVRTLYKYEAKQGALYTNNNIVRAERGLRGVAQLNFLPGPRDATVSVTWNSSVSERTTWK